MCHAVILKRLNEKYDDVREKKASADKCLLHVTLNIVIQVFNHTCYPRK